MLEIGPLTYIAGVLLMIGLTIGGSQWLTMILKSESEGFRWTNRSFDTGLFVGLSGLAIWFASIISWEAVVQSVPLVLVLTGAAIIEGGTKENDGKGSVPVETAGVAILVIGVLIMGLAMH